MLPAFSGSAFFQAKTNEVCAKDIAESFQADKGIVIELWDSMNVLELELSNQNSIDFEPVEASFRNPYFEQLVNKLGGFVSTDSDNFNPFYAGSAK